MTDQYMCIKLVVKTTVIHKPCILVCFIVLDGLNDDDGYEISGGLFGLVLYNPNDRDGAVEEANNLESSLNAIGCQVMKEEWTTKVTLRTHIDHAMDQMAGNSLLVVCIMSHGNAGKLKCDDGDTEMIINDILVLITRQIPDDLPMVRCYYLYLRIRILFVCYKWFH